MGHAARANGGRLFRVSVGAVGLAMVLMWALVSCGPGTEVMRDQAEEKVAEATVEVGEDADATGEGRTGDQPESVIADRLAAQAVSMIRSPDEEEGLLIAPLLALESLRYGCSREAYEVLQGILFDLPEEDPTASLLRAPTGCPVARVRCGGAVDEAILSSDGRYLAVVCADGLVVLIDMSTGCEVSRVRWDLAGVQWVAFSPDSRFFGVLGADHTAVLFETASGREVVRFPDVWGVSFCPCGDAIAVAYLDGGVALVDVTGREVIRTYPPNGGEVGVDEGIFSPDGRFLAVYGTDLLGPYAMVVETATGRAIGRVRHEDVVWKVAFSPDGRFLATAGWDGIAVLFDTSTGREVARFQGEGKVYDVVFSSDGRFLAISRGGDPLRTQPASVLLVEVATGREVTRVEHQDEVWDVVFSPDARFLATTGADLTVVLVETATGREITRVQHEDGLRVVFSPDGRRLATYSNDGTAVLVDTSTGQEVARMEHDGPVVRAAFSPDGDLFATGSEESGVAVLVEAATGRELTRVRHEVDVNEVVFSSDGRFLATAGGDIFGVTSGSAALVDGATGREILRVQHERAATGVAFTADGRFLVTQSDDGTAVLVDLSLGREVTRVRLGAPVRRTILSSEGRYLVVYGGSDVLLFPLDQGVLEDWVCARLPRNMSRQEWDAYVGGGIPYHPTCPNLPVPEE